jgi:hypothetical protein
MDDSPTTLVSGKGELSATTLSTTSAAANLTFQQALQTVQPEVSPSILVNGFASSPT